MRLSKVFEKIKQKRLATLKHTRALSYILPLLTFLFLTYFLVASDLPGRAKFEVGVPAPFDARANKTVRMIDEDATRKAQQEAADQVAPIETFNPYAVQISEAKIDNTISFVRRTRPDNITGKTASTSAQSPTANEAGTNSNLANITDPNELHQSPLTLSTSVFNTLVRANDAELTKYRTVSKELLRQAMAAGIREEELNKARASVMYKAANLTDVSSRCKMVCIELASKALIANRHADATATNEAKRKAADEVIPIIKVIVPGQIVVREGEIVTEDDLPVLEALDLYHQEITLKTVLAKSLLVILIMCVALSFIRVNFPSIHENGKRMVGIAFIVFIYALFSHYLLSVGVAATITPIAIPAILFSMLYHLNIAALISVLLAVYTNAELNSLDTLSSTIIIALASVLSVNKIRKRWDLIHASLIIWFVSMFSCALFTVRDMDNLLSWLYDAAVDGSITGLIFPLIASGILPFLENLLDVTSHMRLLELSNPNEPALHELLTKAPGTYQHSLMVSNLAAAAANEIGADSMLCRTGSFYHDIGKTKQPSMFIENQFGHDNPHDKLSPTLSASVIISHVRFGNEMVAQYKLPPSIAQFVAEHHGDNLASFFYQKAQAQSDTPLSEAGFRYPGPKPRSKETAIVMICDGIEAAARTLPSHTKESIEALVNRMVSTIITNGQLDNSPLSFRDITLIKKSVVRTLTSHYHSRVAYPGAPGSNAPASALPASNRPDSEPNRTTEAKRPGAELNRPAEGNRPGAELNRPVEGNHPDSEPNRPAEGNRPDSEPSQTAEANHPDSETHRSAEPSRLVAESLSRAKTSVSPTPEQGNTTPAAESAHSSTLSGTKPKDDIDLAHWNDIPPKPVINQPEFQPEDDSEVTVAPGLHTTGQAEEKPRTFPAAQRAPKKVEPTISELLIQDNKGR